MKKTIQNGETCFCGREPLTVVRTFVPVPSGFTLLETLVAISLLGVIFILSNSALQLYWKYRAISGECVTSSHILRGLIDDLTGDLRSVAEGGAGATTIEEKQPEVVGTAAVNGTTPPGLERLLRVQEQQLNLQLNDHGTPIHLYGTRDTLALLTCCESARFRQVGAEYHSAGYLHVVWWINKGSSVRIPLTHIGPQKIQTVFDASRLPHGLCRDVKSSDADGRPQRTAEKIKRLMLISDRVRLLLFRYSDGVSWTHEWDSTVRGTVPIAVEITVGMQGDVGNARTFVVAVPQGDARLSTKGSPAP